jgi:type VI secretion system protein ImpG
MDPRLLHYYNRELQHLREMGGEFAKDFPKIAGRLGLEAFECADPYVERLLEGFAFLAARVQLKIDAEFPRFSQHLMELVYPHYLAPTPSMAVVQLQPSLNEGALGAGFRVPSGSVLRSLLGRGEQTACEYRTAHEVTLWPIELVGAEYTGYLGDLGGLKLPTRKTPRAALRLKLRATAGFNFSQLPLEKLPLFLRGGDELAMHVYEQLIGNVIATAVRPADPRQQTADTEVASGPPTRPLGFEDSEALLPYGPRSFQGYRLLQEYFAFPSRFLFVELGGLGAGVRRCKGTELEVVIFLDRHDPTLEGAVGPAHFALFCTPAVNLFPRRADRIHLTNATHEYHVVPDRTRPMDFEVYAINEVTGYGAAADITQKFRPLYAVGEQAHPNEAPGYFTVNRQPRRLSTRQQAQGARSTYVGSEVFVALVDGDEGPFRSELKQLAVATLCTNRDLPLHMPVGQGRTDFSLESGAPVESIRCVAGPTRPQPSHAHGDVSWRLISHLALNYLSLTNADGQGAAPLRQMLSLYADTGELAVRKQIDGVRSVEASPIVRRLSGGPLMTFGRGVEVAVTCDEVAFQGTGVFLLGAVLARFFSKYVSINSFTETVLKSAQRGEIMRWPAEPGRRASL